MKKCDTCNKPIKHHGTAPYCSTQCLRDYLKKRGEEHTDTFQFDRQELDLSESQTAWR